MKTISALILAAALAPAAYAGSSAVDALGPARAVPVPEASPAPERMPDIDFFRYFGYAQAPEGEALEPAYMKGVNEPLYTVALEPIKNAYLKPSVGFTAAGGVRVYVSGTKASNCPDGGNSCADKEKFFLVLTTDSGESFFVRAMEVLNWGIFMSGSKTVIIGGEKYVVKVYANASTPENSKLEIKGPRGTALNATLKQIGDAVAAKGVDIRLSRAYKLAYGNEIVQGPQGGKFTSKMLVLLIPYPVVDASTYYIFSTAEIKPEGTAFPAFEKGYGFSLRGGKLGIYAL